VSSSSTSGTYNPWRLRTRYMRVTFFFARVVLGVFLWDIVLRRMGFLRRLSRRTAPRRYRNAARRFRLLATRMGGVWIKMGQFLSARLDVLPDEVIAELAGLQDEVAVEPLEAMRTVAEAAFGETLEERFTKFEHDPLASASLGQVHRAVLPEGDRVVVKIQRPGIHDLLGIDLAALSTVVSWLKRYRPITRRVNLDALMSEFSRTLWLEVDYLAEAENARRFGAMYADDPEVRIPDVYDEHTTKTVLTLEDVYFIKITDYETITAAGVDLQEVAERLFDTYLGQIFVEGFFHADPHPGNLFIEPIEGDEWRLVFVDFGMVGEITPKTKQALRDIAIAIGTRDLDRLMQAYQDLGALLPGADLDRIRQAEAAMMERIWGKSMRELVRMHPKDMREFAREYRDVLYEMPFQMPENMIFLGRCVAILSGMCTGLDPDFNLFQGLRPFAEDLIADEAGDTLRVLLESLLEQVKVLATLPTRVDGVLTKIERGEMVVVARPAPELQRQLHRMTRATNRLMAAVVFAAALLSGSLFYINGELVFAGVGFSLAALALIFAMRR
jgi:predicted unusual protein kinase regulating ubiquinone biosynthesis (AarF/ABC1/UbiB family)